MKVYISGAMSRHKDLNRPAFEKAEELLTKNGYEAINPHKIGHKTDNWVLCMKKDIIALMECNAIYMLKGWHRSKGARLEWFIAKCLQYGEIK